MSKPTVVRHWVYRGSQYRIVHSPAGHPVAQVAQERFSLERSDRNDALGDPSWEYIGAYFVEPSESSGTELSRNVAALIGLIVGQFDDVD